MMAKFARSHGLKCRARAPLAHPTQQGYHPHMTRILRRAFNAFVSSVGWQIGRIITGQGK